MVLCVSKSILFNRVRLDFWQPLLEVTVVIVTDIGNPQVLT